MNSDFNQISQFALKSAYYLYLNYPIHSLQFFSKNCIQLCNYIKWYPAFVLSKTRIVFNYLTLVVFIELFKLKQLLCML